MARRREQRLELKMSVKLEKRILTGYAPISLVRDEMIGVGILV